MGLVISSCIVFVFVFTDSVLLAVLVHSAVSLSACMVSAFALIICFQSLDGMALIVLKSVGSSYFSRVRLIDWLHPTSFSSRVSSVILVQSFVFLLSILCKNVSCFFSILILVYIRPKEKFNAGVGVCMGRSKVFFMACVSIVSSSFFFSCGEVP